MFMLSEHSTELDHDEINTCIVLCVTVYFISLILCLRRSISTHKDRFTKFRPTLIPVKGCHTDDIYVLLSCVEKIVRQENHVSH